MDTGNEDFSIANSSRQPSEMQTSPCYCGIVIPTDTQVHSQSYSMYSLARFVTYRCPNMVDSRKIHLILCLPGIFCSNLLFW